MKRAIILTRAWAPYYVPQGTPGTNWTGSLTCLVLVLLQRPKTTKCQSRSLSNRPSSLCLCLFMDAFYLLSKMVFSKRVDCILYLTLRTYLHMHTALYLYILHTKRTNRYIIRVSSYLFSLFALVDLMRHLNLSYKPGIFSKNKGKPTETSQTIVVLRTEI